jgi:hypothetical protein
MAYSDWLQGFRNFYIQDRVNSYGRRPGVFINIAKEKPQDVKVVDRFEVLDKGCQLWVQNERYPIRGNTPEDKVSVLTQYKKIIPMWVRFLTGYKDELITFTKKNKVQQFLILLGLIQYKEFFINWIWYGLQEVYSDVDCYIPPVREIYRLIKDEKIRDIVCAVLAYDTAYRYRFQDLIGELSKENFNRNPYKEIKRLMELGLIREVHPEGGKGVHGLHKIKKIIPLFNLYLRFNRKLLKEIKEIVEQIDINEVKLSVEDIYWTNRYPDYDFRGLDIKTRLEQYENTKHYKDNN